MRVEVVEVLFFGSYYELKGLLEVNVITIRTLEDGFVKGDVICVSISLNAECFL